MPSMAPPIPLPTITPLGDWLICSQAFTLAIGPAQPCQIVLKEGMKVNMNPMLWTIVACGMTALGVMANGGSVPGHAPNASVQAVDRQDERLVLMLSWKVSAQSDGST